MRRSREPLYVVLRVVIGNWTNDRSKWISLNSGFIEQILHEKCMCVEIAVVVSH